MEKKPRTKKNKLNSKEYLEQHPDLYERIKELNSNYLSCLKQIFEINKEVDANVKISFQLINK